MPGWVIVGQAQGWATRAALSEVPFQWVSVSSCCLEAYCRGHHVFGLGVYYYLGWNPGLSVCFHWPQERKILFSFPHGKWSPRLPDNDTHIAGSGYQFLLLYVTSNIQDPQTLKGALGYTLGCSGPIFNPKVAFGAKKQIFHPCTSYHIPKI